MQVTKMPLSKKYYEEIAESLCDAHSIIPKRMGEDCHLVLDQLTNALAQNFKADNPRFDKERFLKAVHAKKCKI